VAEKRIGRGTALMRQLYLYVEGQTEQTFADVVLKPHLAQFDVFLMGAVLAEFGRKKQKVSRGGVTRYTPFTRGLTSLIKQHNRQSVTISTMIDLYALPDDFPGWTEAEKFRVDPMSRVVRLEQELASDINPNPTRFIPYIQLHEYEALLFVDPTKMSMFYSEYPEELAELLKIAEANPHPELIDDGKQTAPSKRIIAHLPDYEDAKPVVGPQVAERIGLSALRAKCSHFDHWVKSLEELGQTPTTL
jgi:hypothetical protein